MGLSKLSSELRRVNTAPGPWGSARLPPSRLLPAGSRQKALGAAGRALLGGAEPQGQGMGPGPGIGAGGAASSLGMQAGVLREPASSGRAVPGDEPPAGRAAGQSSCGDTAPRIPHPRSHIPNLTSRIPNLTSQISHPASHIPHPKSHIPHPASRIPLPAPRAPHPAPPPVSSAPLRDSPAPAPAGPGTPRAGGRPAGLEAGAPSRGRQRSPPRG